METNVRHWLIPSFELFHARVMDKVSEPEAFSEGPPTLHTIQKQANSAAWEKIRNQMRLGSESWPSQ